MKFFTISLISFILGCFVATIIYAIDVAHETSEECKVKFGEDYSSVLKKDATNTCINSKGEIKLP